MATPTDRDIADAVRAERRRAPGLGATKMRDALKVAHPEWSLSESRLRRVMKEHNLGLPHPSAAAPTEGDPPPTEEASGAGSTSKIRPGAPGFYRVNLDASPPVLPANAREEQIRYQDTSPRPYRLYGRGTKWDYPVTWNSDMQLLVTIAQNRMKEAGMPVGDKQKQQWSDNKMINIIFEQLWPAAQRAGLTRDDLGRQLEAEWGGNPVPYIFYPRTPRELAVWEAQRADEARSYKQNSMQLLRKMAREVPQVKVDHRGEPIWDDEINGQYVAILTRLHKGTDIECGDLPRGKGWDYDMPCSHNL